MKFVQLLQAINQVHVSLQSSAVKAVNWRLTFRKWLIGYYIVEFEQNGEDKAAYGLRLREKIAEKIVIKNRLFLIYGGASSSSRLTSRFLG